MKEEKTVNFYKSIWKKEKNFVKNFAPEDFNEPNKESIDYLMWKNVWKVLILDLNGLFG